MSRPEIPQDLALTMQLATIIGHEPASSYLELRPLGPQMQPAAKDRAFIPVGQLDEIAARIGEQATRLNVFIGVAPRVREGGTADDVERVWCLWCDCDGPNSLARLAHFTPLPSLVIRSGSDDACHAYWPLTAPLSPAWAQRANRRLALALDADRAATDPARILRPARSFNHKHRPSRPVVCTRAETAMFTWSDVVKGLPDDRAYRPAERPEREHKPAGDASRLIEAIARVVAEKPEGERNHALFWAACRVAEHAAAGELDEDAALVELRAAAAHAGLGEVEIEKTLASGLAAGKRAA